MKLFYRISIFINIVFACYILVKGSELLTKDLIGAKNVRNAQQSYYKKQSADLEKLDDTVITGGNFSKTGSGKIKMSKSASVSTEINLLGKTVDEAIMELDKYLDDAYIAHLPSVRIVHGKGTGALRTAVHQYLKRCKHVKSFRLGTFGEGDAGVTIAEFK
mgnify:CR=1 FL=1